METLEGLTALVTGGTKGIGRAVVETLLGDGASVAFSARTAADVESALATLGAAHPGRTAGTVGDVRDPADADRMVADTVAAFGHLDVLVNNAGVGIFGAVEDMSDDDWSTQLDTNLSGVFHCCRAALPHLRRRGGWIINVGSLAGRNAFAGGAAYNATKFGLIGFTEALMLEVRHDGVRVTCVMPGSVATEFGGTPAEGDWKLQGEDVARVVRDLLDFPPRALPSRVELRPSMPPRK